METPRVELILIAVAILANGFFAGSEIALVSGRISRLAQPRPEAARCLALFSNFSSWTSRLLHPTGVTSLPGSGGLVGFLRPRMRAETIPSRPRRGI